VPSVLSAELVTHRACDAATLNHTVHMSLASSTSSHAHAYLSNAPPLPPHAYTLAQTPPPHQAKPAKKQYAAVAKAISQFEPVTMWADPSVAEEAKQYLADAPNVTVQVRHMQHRLFSVLTASPRPVSQRLGDNRGLSAGLL
jgi:hypothetical protein